MPATDHIVGVVLAGGRSRRFGGGDKGLAEFGGGSMLARVIDRFRPQVGRVLLNVNGDAERFADLEVETLPDGENPELGPLSGLLAAMDWAIAHGSGATIIVSVSSDVPFLPDDLVQRLQAARNEGVAIAMSAGRRHPTIGLWPLSRRARVADALARRALSVNQLALDLDAVAVAFPMRKIGGREIDPFFNINTPEDLATARILAQMEG